MKVAETVAGRATPTARTEGAVLLVDADPNVAELLTTNLVVQGFQVYTAADGPAAVERARAVRPDAVILEVTLPGMEDFELLGRLRARGVDAPGLLLTTRAVLQDRLTSLTVGGDDDVSKPFSAEEVVARLRAILPAPATIVRRTVVPPGVVCRTVPPVRTRLSDLRSVPQPLDTPGCAGRRNCNVNLGDCAGIVQT
jgi:CheY-like chemotaxis protein